MTDNKKRDTVGKIATDLSQKEPDTRDPIELEREIHKEYENNIIECIKRAKKEVDGDFYVVVSVKKERLLPNVIRNLFFYTHSCPTPTYDQTVYRYIKKEDMLEFLWVIPDKETCIIFKDKPLQVEEKELLYYVLSFYDGTLDIVAGRLNKEIKE